MNSSAVKKREANYDLLRIAATVAVVLLHVSTYWLNGYSATASKEGMQELNYAYPLLSCIYNSLPRFGVPCFLMLTGAFVLNSDRNREYGYFYPKSFNRIGIPVIVFSILYTLYKIPFCFTGGAKGTSEFAILVKDIIIGAPFYHMWYMYMLIGIYILIPVAIRFKESVSEAAFNKTAAVFLVVGTLSGWTTGKVQLNWSIGLSFEYFGYVLAGCAIYSRAEKNTRKGIGCILLGIAVETAAAFVQYYFMIVKGIAESSLTFSIVGEFSPAIVAASVLIFCGFGMLDIKESRHVRVLSDLSFFIYLIHAGVWDFMTRIFAVFIGRDALMQLNCIWAIPVFTVFVFYISVLLARLYGRINIPITKKFACVCPASKTDSQA